MFFWRSQTHEPTKSLRKKIVEMFKGGASINEIAHWYEKDGPTIEDILREGLLTDGPEKERGDGFACGDE